MLAGAAGGFTYGLIDGYNQTGTLSGALQEGVLDGSIGALGVIAGGLAAMGAGVFAAELSFMAGLSCADTSLLTAVASGAAFGYGNGFVSGGLQTGTLDGAFGTANQGALTGAVMGGVFGSIFGDACFAAGTELLVPSSSDGGRVWKSIETFSKGSLIWHRDEFDPSAPLQVGVVEEVFVSRAKTVVLTVSIRTIRTTNLHRIFIRSRGWIPGLPRSNRAT